jgi:hypothetical protein
LLKSENHGDLLLTEEFSKYVRERKFRPYFCRKADPESKGKIENVIKYIKYNFLRGRKFYTIDILNEQALQWLARTANAKEHSTIRKIPAEQWLIEKSFLQAFTGCIPLPESKAIYHVRKDNLISYKGNQYTVPTGTYENPDTIVLVKVRDRSLEIYTNNEQLICTHTIDSSKGHTIRNTHHLRDNTHKIQPLIEQVCALFTDQELATIFLEHIRKEKSRYVRDQLALIRKETMNSESAIAHKSLEYCIKNHLYSATEYCDVLRHFKRQQQAIGSINLSAVNILMPVGDTSLMMHYQPNTSDINDYQSIIQ